MAEKRWKWAALIAVFAVIVFAGAAVKKAKVRSFTGIIESVSGVTAVVETDDLRDEYRGTVRVSVILDSETAARAAVGDELLVTRGGALGIQNQPERYFAGNPQKYYDPVGGALTGLVHMEVGLLLQEIVR